MTAVLAAGVFEGLKNDGVQRFRMVAQNEKDIAIQSAIYNIRFHNL